MKILYILVLFLYQLAITVLCTVVPVLKNYSFSSSSGSITFIITITLPALELYTVVFPVLQNSIVCDYSSLTFTSISTTLYLYFIIKSPYQMMHMHSLLSYI